jgi:hypothetical protein
MMGVSFWMGHNTGPRPTPTPTHDDSRERLRELEHEIQRVKLLNQALWEVLREKTGLTDAELEKKIHEVDLRDGMQDGRMTETPLKCPTCGRVSSSKHWKCLYCGQLFEKPLMG